MPRCRTLRILLLDDQCGFARELGPRIQSLGHEVTFAAQTTLLAVARTSLPDVLVLSLDLSEPTAAELGQGLCDQAGLRTPLVVGLADPEKPEASDRAANIGAHLVLMMPLELAVLAGVLRRFRELLAGLEG
jgi:PleD family two-component response regulator